MSNEEQAISPEEEFAVERYAPGKSWQTDVTFINDAFSADVQEKLAKELWEVLRQRSYNIDGLFRDPNTPVKIVIEVFQKSEPTKE